MTDTSTLPLEPPRFYDPDEERWVAERQNPHASRDELYEQAIEDPNFTIAETMEGYEADYPHYTPVEIIDGTPDETVIPVSDPGTDHFDTAYTNHSVPTQTVGQPALNITVAAAQGLVTDATAMTRYTVKIGPGILIGYQVVTVGAQTAKLAAIVDANNDDGTILALINPSINQGGMVSLGHDGIQFNKGLTILRNAADNIIIIPIIRREVPVHLGEK